MKKSEVSTPLVYINVCADVVSWIEDCDFTFFGPIQRNVQHFSECVHQSWESAGCTSGGITLLLEFIQTILLTKIMRENRLCAGLKLHTPVGQTDDKVISAL